MDGGPGQRQRWPEGGALVDVELGGAGVDIPTHPTISS